MSGTWSVTPALSHWSYSSDSKTCLILVSAGTRRHRISEGAAHDLICQLSRVFVKIVYSPHWLGTIIVKTWSWSMKTWTSIWSGKLALSSCQVDRGERGTWYANYWMCAQVNMSVMSTEINLISNRKNYQAREHEELCTNDCGIVKLLDLSFSQLSKETFQKNELLVQLIT